MINKSIGILLILIAFFTSCKKKDESKTEETPSTTTTGSVPTPTVSSWSVMACPINTASFNNDLRDVHFFNKNNGIAVGWTDLVVKTNNGGETWQLVPSFTTNQLLGICFMADSLTAYVVGLLNIYKTTDACATWTECAQAANTNIGGYSSTFFFNASTGFVGGDQGIMKTTNGGTTWNKINNAPKLINKIKFTSPSIGWASKQDSIFRTTDGGNTWQYANATYTISNTAYFLDDNTAFRVRKLSGGENIIKTTNGGASWSSVVTSTTSNYFINDVWYMDVNNAFACTSNNNPLQVSTNSGLTWSTIPLTNLPTNASVNKLFFTSLTTGFAVGGNGLIIRYVK